MGSRIRPPKLARPRVSPEDEALFLGAIDGAVPLAQRDRVPPVPVRSAIAIVPREVLPPTHVLTVEGSDGELAARAPGVNRAQIADLRRGLIRAEATLDLHGHTAAEATPMLEKFLLDSARLRRRCVLVIHGKGLHGGGIAVLRELVLHHLVGVLSGLVHAFSPAAPNDGGAGATYVMVRA